MQPYALLGCQQGKTFFATMQRKQQLAIAQAAAYLNGNRMLFAMYLRHLRSTEQDTVALVNRELRETRYKVSATAVSFSQIRERDAAAADPRAFMSCSEWKAILRSPLPRVQPRVQAE